MYTLLSSQPAWFVGIHTCTCKLTHICKNTHSLPQAHIGMHAYVHACNHTHTANTHTHTLLPRMCTSFCCLWRNASDTNRKLHGEHREADHYQHFVTIKDNSIGVMWSEQCSSETTKTHTHTENKIHKFYARNIMPVYIVLNYQMWSHSSFRAKKSTVLSESKKNGLSIMYCYLAIQKKGSPLL